MTPNGRHQGPLRGGRSTGRDARNLYAAPIVGRVLRVTMDMELPRCFTHTHRQAGGSLGACLVFIFPFVCRGYAYVAVNGCT